MIETKLINVTDFLHQYESENTRNSYRVGLKSFFKLIYPGLKDEDLDGLAEKYLREDRNHREDIISFRNFLRNKAPKTRYARLIAVRVFLDDNGINFPKRFFKNMNGKRTEAITWEKVPTNEELKRIVEYLPMQGKALALILSSSGMRISEVVKIKESDIEFNRDPVRIKIRAEYTKTGKRRITFISPEAKEVIDEWLKYRDQYIKIANIRSTRYARGESNCLFPFRAENFNTMWRNALGKAKLLEIDEKTNRMTMRPHNLRKFFRLRVGRYGRDEAECLMGHQAGLNRIYANFDDAEERLKEVYVKSIPDLSIYRRTSVITDESFKKEIKKNEDTINVLIKDGYVKDKKIEYLSNEVEELKEKMKKKTEEDEETKRKIANMELDIQSWNTLKPIIEKLSQYTVEDWESLDITSKNLKVTAED